MRVVITGIRDGRSCIDQEIDITPEGEGFSARHFVDLQLDSLPARPPGRGHFANIPIEPGILRWSRLHFPPDEQRRMHHSDTIDCITVIEGSTDLLLDDGAHRLLPGDSAMLTGVDHGWHAGPEGCVALLFMLATPAPDLPR